MLSPVRADSSTALCPSITTPSAGMLSPGRTVKISSFFSCSIGILTSLPSTKTVAVVGESFNKPLSAFVVFPFDLASSILPNVMSVTIIAADSK